jgi:hypothetical protein
MHGFNKGARIFVLALGFLAVLSVLGLAATSSDKEPRRIKIAVLPVHYGPTIVLRFRSRGPHSSRRTLRQHGAQGRYRHPSMQCSRNV